MRALFLLKRESFFSFSLTSQREGARQSRKSQDKQILLLLLLLLVALQNASCSLACLCQTEEWRGGGRWCRQRKREGRRKRRKREKDARGATSLLLLFSLGCRGGGGGGGGGGWRRSERVLMLGRTRTVVEDFHCGAQSARMQPLSQSCTYERGRSNDVKLSEGMGVILRTGRG